MIKLLLLVSEDSYFVSHRFDLAKALQRAGCEVALATRCSMHLEAIEGAGIRVFPLHHFGRGHQTLKATLLGLIELYHIYRTYKPDVVHHVAVKPVIFGSLIAWITRVPRVFNALGGLGYLFTDSFAYPEPLFQPTPRPHTLSELSVHPTSEPRTKRLKKAIYRRIFCFTIKWLTILNKSTLILQNQDDKADLIKQGCIRENQVVIIPGCGIDPQFFPVAPFPSEPPVIITCISRMLWDKGIGELVAAAKQLQQNKLPVRVLLFGQPDAENPASISEQQLRAWHNQGLIEWQGFCKDVPQAYADCHIAVLPSYREGLPKSLLEAACCGRPIVTTDVPGCREIVRDGYNGYLVPARDSGALYHALKLLVKDPDLRKTVGEHSRQVILDKFNADDITQRFITLFSKN